MKRIYFLLATMLFAFFTVNKTQAQTEKKPSLLSSIRLVPPGIIQLITAISFPLTPSMGLTAELTELKLALLET